MDIATAEPGTTLFKQRMTISRGAVDAYVSAVEDGNALYAAENIAPPMAVAALVMAQALKAIELPPGSVHTGQELEFSAPVPTGIEIACTATVSQNSVRRGTRFVALDIVGEVDGQCAVAGKVSLAIPETERGA
jgi:acyl dehydratase